MKRLLCFIVLFMVFYATVDDLMRCEWGSVMTDMSFLIVQLIGINIRDTLL